MTNIRAHTGVWHVNDATGALAGVDRVEECAVLEKH